MTTFCESCKHVYRANKTDRSRYWLCVRHKRSETQMGFVTQETWDEAPPYLYCVQVNAGHCPLYEEAQPGQMKLLGDEDGA